MDIHEYQAKELLSGFGVSIPRGGLAYSPEQASYRAQEIGGDAWVVKAQIHSGARGKAGGMPLTFADRLKRDTVAGNPRQMQARRYARGMIGDKAAGS